MLNLLTIEVIMKYLILLLTLLVIGCNPFNYGDTVELKFQDENYYYSFDCNKETADRYMGMYQKTDYNKGNGLEFKKVGLKMFDRKDSIVVRVTYYDYLIAQDEFTLSRNMLIYNAVKRYLSSDTLMCSNLRVWY